MKTIIYSILALLAFAGCQKDQTETVIDNSKIVEISTSIGERSIFDTRTAPLGATVEDRSSFFNGDKIAVSNASQGGKWVTYTYDGADWDFQSQFEAGEFLTWDAEQMTFNAYYPAISGVSMTEFTLPTNQNEDGVIEMADWMTVENLQISQCSAVALNFQRKTARVNIKIDGFDLPYTEMPTVSNLRIYSGKESATGTTPIAITPHYDEASDTYTALVLPTDAKDTETFITLTANDSKEERVVGIPALLAGETYTYNLTVGKKRAKIGDYYYSDGTWSTDLDDTKTPMGVIFSVGADGKSGKVVSLVESDPIQWSTEERTSGATYDIGHRNMYLVGRRIADFFDYPVFFWVYVLNIDAGIDPQDYFGIELKGVWYLPAINELRELYAGASGLQWVPSDGEEIEGSTIKDWSDVMPNYADYQPNRDNFNAKISMITGSQGLSDFYYWSSNETEVYAYAASDAQLLYFNNGNTDSRAKRNHFGLHARAILAF